MFKPYDVSIIPAVAGHHQLSFCSNLLATVTGRLDGAGIGWKREGNGFSISQYGPHGTFTDYTVLRVKTPTGPELAKLFGQQPPRTGGGLATISMAI